MALLREFVNQLEGAGLLKRVQKEVDIQFEIPAIMRTLDGIPIIFENVKNRDIPVLGNICSSRLSVARGLGIEEGNLTEKLVDAISQPRDPQIMKSEDYIEMEPDLLNLPIPTYYPFDGGPYITSGIVVAKDPEYGLNSSFHRGMVISENQLVLRIVKRDLDSYIRRGLTKFAYCIGNPISVLVASAVSESPGVSELSIANSLQPTPLMDMKGYLVPPAEIIMIMELTGELHDEGPFLDLTQTPDKVRLQPVVECKEILIRRNPLFHALLPGGMEHKILMGMPREASMYREVKKQCDVLDVRVTPGGCSWLHGVVSIRRREEKDPERAIDAAFRAHRSMKHLFVVDEDIDIDKSEEIEWAMATRFQADSDLVTRREKGSSLDPSSDPETHITTKVGFDLTVPWGKDKEEFKRPGLPMEIDIEEYLED